MSKAFVKDDAQVEDDLNLDADLDEEDSDVPAASRGKNYITTKGLAKLKEELHHLLFVDRPKVVETVAWAASNGDRSENADYQYGKRRLREIDRRVRLRGAQVALFYLGFCFQARKNWRLALRNFEEALQNLNENETHLRKEAMYYLAIGHAETNDFNRALELGSELANLDYNYKNIGALLDQWQAKAAK